MNTGNGGERSRLASPILRAIYASTAHADLLDGNWGDHPLPLDEIVAYALAGEYETVGISLLTATIPTARALSQRLKAQRPRLQIIWGGYHPTFAPYESLNDFPEIDIVVRGEGEATLLELLREEMRLTGTHMGCMTGHCGVCKTWMRYRFRRVICCRR